MNIANWDVRVAFRTAILNVATIPDANNRAWENRSFEPTSDTPWIREKLLPGDKTVTANEELSAVGIMQFDLFYPIGSGTKEAEQVANDIESHFKPTTVLSDLVRIEQSNALDGRKDRDTGAWWHIPVQISYKVHSIT